jgi:hypothetical protein
METTDSQKYKTIAKFVEPMPAQILVAFLNDNGIPAAVFNLTSPVPSLGYALPIEVKVNESDFDRALALVPEQDRVQE